jgi:hypothetical protein
MDAGSILRLTGTADPTGQPSGVDPDPPATTHHEQIVSSRRCRGQVVNDDVIVPAGDGAGLHPTDVDRAIDQARANGQDRAVGA